MTETAETVSAAPLDEPFVARSQPTWIFAVTLLLSSSLLFVVQPMFAKMALPRLGGSPGVWNTCMVFFQACLLLGYLYAHGLTKLRPVNQIRLHLIVLLLPLLVLPIALPAWKPPTEWNPTGWLLMALAATVGLPFLVVSATAPLLQSWFARAGRRNGADADPYFLYAASNVGSMAALLAYPLIIEPQLRVATQARWWAYCYAFLIIFIYACGIRMRLVGQQEAASAQPRITTPAPTMRQKLRWLLLAFIPSSYLLGVTTFITSDIAAVPLLWIVPLALYLLSFVFVFAARPPLKHKLMVYALPTVCLLTVTFMLARAAQPLALVAGLHLLSLFVVSMVCHGELARTRPPAEHLTEFYLVMSLGGVLGGAFNALLAPLIFSRTLEYPIAIILACLIVPSRASIRGHEKSKPDPLFKKRGSGLLLDWVVPVVVLVATWYLMKYAPAKTRYIGNWSRAFVLLAPPVLLTLGQTERKWRFAACVAALVLVAAYAPPPGARVLETHRSFFGVHRVMRTGDGKFNEILHGTTLHGTQRADAAGKPIDPQFTLTYYHQNGPIGQMLRTLPAERRQNIAVVGLGIGSIAAYTSAPQKLTYFEIDPVVRDIAESSGWFTFLKAARERGADVKVILGDARLTLADVPDGSFDLLALDAFSGDAIPMHLLTRESFALCRKKLKPNGVLAVHISNTYLDLRSTIANLAADAGCICFYRDDRITTRKDDDERKLGSQWTALVKSRDDFGELANDPRWIELPADKRYAVWTDDFSNIMSVLRWKARQK